ncbi:MAG: hypothetical protein PUD83_01165, partial [Bacteroidales bacterium]|nr:hypothetical protein [Bacteroidales bacterium]
VEKICQKLLFSFKNHVFLFKMQENGHKKHRVKQQKTPFLCGLCPVLKTSVTNWQSQQTDS